MQKLQDLSIYKDCYRFIDKFDSYAKQEGYYDTGADILFLFALAKVESNCKSRFVDKPSLTAGMLQVVAKCTADPSTNQCHSVDDEIRFGVAHFTADIKKMFDSGVYGRHALWLIAFSFNRGRGTALNAIKFMNEGMTIQDATDKACAATYMNKQSVFRNAYSCSKGFDWAVKKYGCPSSSSEAICANGRECSLNAFCDVAYPDVGVHYADKIWHSYLDVCSDIGGQMTDSELPSLPEQATVNPREEVTGVAAQVINHPYFDVPYSIDPSFSVDLPFNLSIYDEIPEHMKVLDRCKNDISCIVANVSQIDFEDPEMDWLLKYGGEVVSSDMSGNSEATLWMAYCESPDVFAVNSMAEALDAAKASSGGECVVKYSLPNPDASLIDSLYSSAVTALRDVLGLATFGASELVFDWGDSKPLVFLKSKDSVRIFISGGGSPAQVVEGVRFTGIMPSAQGKSDLELRIAPGRSFDVYRDEKGNISIYAAGDAPVSDICEVNNKIVKFCILQNKSVLAYDEGKNKFGTYRLAIKFAYLFNTDVTDVEDFEVRDAKYAANSSLLSWSALAGVDVNHYTIYYSLNSGLSASLKEVPPSEAVNDAATMEDVTTLALPVAEKSEVLGFDLDQEPLCTVGETSPLTCALRYGVPSETVAEDLEVEFSDSTLYYSMNEKKYLYFLPGIADGERYFFAITATDVNGQESPMFTVVADDAYEVAVADAPPGLVQVNSIGFSGGNAVITAVPVDYTVDGGYLDPSLIKHFRIFCADSPVDIDLLQKTSFFESSFSVLDDGSLEIIADQSNFNSANCGFLAPPAQASIVIAPVIMDQLSEVYYKGTVMSASFSNQFEVPAMSG
jgi:hypothetical protein